MTEPPKYDELVGKKVTICYLTKQRKCTTIKSVNDCCHTWIIFLLFLKVNGVQRPYQKS